MTRPSLADDQLRRNRLLATLPEADLARLKPWLTPLTLVRSRVLFDPGDEVETTYFPCHSSLVSLLIVLRDGREVEAATIGYGGAVGGIISRGHKPAFGRAMVQIAGPAYAISTQRLEDAKQQSARLGNVFSQYSDILAAQMMQSVACNALHSLEQRCSRWLLSTHDRVGADIIQLTQEALAEMLGVQRTSVTAVARQLSDKRLIRYQRGRIEILNRSGLEAESCECYAAVEAHFDAVFREKP